MLQRLIDFTLHLDRSLGDIIAEHGAWAYAVLFAVVFCETGLVVLPFLPGDSLLFATGALCAKGQLGLGVVVPLFFAAAALGDSVNYFVGSRLRERVASGRKIPLVRQKHLDRTHAFFGRYGRRAVVMARFVPILRTIAPFVAGVGAMGYPRFIGFSVLGTAAWVLVCVGAGYAFGTHPFVQEHFSTVILGVIVVSLLPMVVEVVRHWLSARPGRGGSAGRPS